MTTTTATTNNNRTTSTTGKQLALFAAAPVSERFRIDEATKRRGRKHIAEIKAMLEDRRIGRPTTAARQAIGAHASGRAA